MIRVECPECDYRFKVSDEKAGRRVRCPDCDARVEVPDDEIDDRDEDEDDRPVRKKKRRKKARSDSWFTPNHIRGLVGTVLGALMIVGLAVTLLTGGNAGRPTSYLMGQVVGLCFAVVLLLAGLYYMIFEE